jgi:phage terminase large subunit-like protein
MKKNVAITSRDPVTTYARRVCGGKILAGPHVRAACQRHLNDLQQAAKRGFFFDLKKVERVIGFFRDVLKLNGGKYEGKPYILLDWQIFIVGSLFGWVNSAGKRRFSVAYIEAGKGCGKTPLVAGIGIYGLVADNEKRAEIYTAATKKDQAMVLFRDAVAMVDQSPMLSKAIKKSGTGISVWNLAYNRTGSFFRPISSDDGKSGPRPHIALIDELHEHKTNVAIEMMRAGVKFREQPLIIIITNSGSNKRSPVGNYHEYATKIANNELKNEEFFSYVCALDKDDNPIKSEKCWDKVNPSLKAGLPGKKYLRAQVNEARGLPSKEALVRRLNFCEWTEAVNPWISQEIWAEAQRNYDWRELKGRRAYGGLDLGSTTDLTGLVLWIEPVEPNEPWKMVPFAWLPDEGLGSKEEKDKVPYFAWKAAGYLETTQGRAISKRAILRRIIELQDFFDIQCIGYDRWGMKDLLQMAIDDQIRLPEMVEHGQGYRDMNPALNDFEVAILNREVVHNGHPVLTWCAANAVIDEDNALNRKLSKLKATARIDLIVAAVMAAAVSQSTRLRKKRIVPRLINL